MAKIFTFKGKTVPELQELSLEAFGKLAQSHVRRKIKRGMEKNPTFKRFYKKVLHAQAEKKMGKTLKPIRTHLRDFVVIPQMIGLQVAIHSGKEFKIRDIEPEMLGEYLGALVLTRNNGKPLIHGKAGIGATRSSTAVATRKT